MSDASQAVVFNKTSGYLRSSSTQDKHLNQGAGLVVRAAATQAARGVSHVGVAVSSYRFF